MPPFWDHREISRGAAAFAVVVTVACASAGPRANPGTRSADVPRTVTTEPPNQEPASVATGPAAFEILIDVSGSMFALADAALFPADVSHAPSRRATRTDIANRTAIQLLERRARDSVGVTLFAKSTARLEGARNDPNALIQAIQKLPNRAIDAGGSDLMLGLVDALDALSETNAASKELVVLTDGDVNDETSEVRDPVDFAKKLGVRVMVLQIGKLEDTKVVASVDLFNVPHFQPMHVTINHVLLTRVTDGTGGERIIAADRVTLESAVERLGRSLP